MKGGCWTNTGHIPVRFYEKEAQTDKVSPYFLAYQWKVNSDPGRRGAKLPSTYHVLGMGFQINQTWCLFLDRRPVPDHII